MADEASSGPQEQDERQPARREQILDAALDEFAGKGFRGATIKGIAARARLKSQALIYWYYPTKEALFEAVVDRHLPVLRFLLDPTGYASQPPDVALPRIAHAFLSIADLPPAARIARLLLPEMIRRPDAIEMLGQPVIMRALALLKAYLDQQVEVGALRQHDTRASSRAFIGMLLPQLGGKLFFPALRQDNLTDAEHIATVVEIFLRGLRIEGAEE